MPRNAWYIDWFNSPFYYQLYADRNDKEAADFLQHLIGYLKPIPGSRMLDVACGRGRYSKTLASLGFDVTGTDLSDIAINYAKRFEKENLQFYVHDMRLPFWINYFDYAFNFFTSFGYFRTRREHDDAIRTLSKSLKENGTLVIDYLNVHYCEKRLVQEEVKHLSNTTYDIRRWDDDTHFYKKIVIRDPALSKPLEFTEEVAKFTLGDFTDMLSYQGMQVTNVFGDYQLHSYDTETTPRMIILAEKIKP
ncbi:MAG TPA: class I SAM-dependent methyltransferase [Chitinophagaceae bacterium]|jgi:SAM-dependent methyltransferase|nr:class I SAM-dependent methyltransferase [Chitinophagaceae bacterium]